MFVDYYEILESSPNAHPSTIDQLFICLAKRYHPDVPNSGDKQKFEKIAEAYQTLRIPATRDKYDAKYSSEQGKSKAPVIGSHAKASDAIEVDVADRHELLALFYKKRRDNINDPGLAVGGIEHQVDYPLNVLKFHLWYCTQKGWLHREESGQLAITSAGVDKMESTVTMNALNASKHMLAGSSLKKLYRSAAQFLMLICSQFS